MNTYIRHIVFDMKDDMIQRCILCGEVISDYQNAMWPDGQPPPKGLPAGDIYVRAGSPAIYQTDEPIEGFSNCKKYEA